jgi:CheY-like chemotaxis protein/anti-sigma regulatory factor (Ser/Thr protein kinase)
LSDTSCIVLADSVKVRQVLTNLINNAIKFTDKGHIKFGYVIKHNALEFFVEDTGIGIDPVHHDKVFERFRKAENGKEKFYDGVGLGLAICKGIVELLNGEIRLESEKGKGSTFFFTIPYEPVNQTDVTGIINSSVQLNLKEETLLVAEDDEINYLYIRQIFKGTGFEILRAKNGKEAVEICEKNDRISIILMDIKMPVMNGYEAIKLIREIRPDVKIIAQTAFALNDEKEKALKVGCNDYISKPFRKDQLLALIAKHHFEGKV